MDLLAKPFIIDWFGEEYNSGLRGNVLLACDGDESHRKYFRKHFPECNFIITDIVGHPDYVADICSDDWVEKTLAHAPDNKIDFVISVATIEHVVDPIKMLRNIFEVSDKLIIHSVEKHGFHPFPIDCYRFMKCWPDAVAKHLNLKIKYKEWSDHFYVFFEKNGGG